MRFSFVFSVLVIVLIFRQDFVIAQPKYTDKEKDAIKKFRELVKDDLYMDYMKSDTYLIKWLRTKNFDQNDARVMLQKTMNWRKQHKVDTILKEKIGDSKIIYFHADGTDYNGSLVVTTSASRFDVRKLIVTGKKYSIGIRIWIQAWERILQDVMERVGAIGNNTMKGTTTDLVTIIINEDGYNLRQHGCLTCWSMYYEWFMILENYYPGFLKHLIYINTPRIYSSLMEHLTPVISIQTKKSLTMYGKNKAEWQNALNKTVPASERRREFGGTKSN